MNEIPYDNMDEPIDISEFADSTIQETMLSTGDLDQEEASIWIDEKELQHEKRGVLNNALILLSDGRNSPVSSTLNTSWEDVSKTQQKYYIRKAKEVFQTALSVIVPGQEEQLWNCIRYEEVVTDKESEPAKKKTRLDTGVVDTLISSYEDADNWQTKLQLLSLFANDFSKTELTQMIPGISKWRIDRARRHAIDVGVGQPPVEQPIYRTRLEPVKTDHFIDFISRPCFLQDVAYGTRKLKLDSGGHAVIPAVIRTLIPSRIIAQYNSYCSDIEFEPASERTLFRILEVCSASMQKSLHGLDYLITEGVQAFESLESIAETLRSLGNVSESWYEQCKQQMKNGKRYLKSDFKLHVSDEERSADHCIAFALSDTGDSSFRKPCSHRHGIICDSCQDIVAVIQEISQKITDDSFTPDDGTRARMKFDHDNAKAAINVWKAHNVRTVNQVMAKQDVLSNLAQNSCLIVMDWAMKLLPMYYREHMKNFFGKKGKSWHVSAVIVKQDGGFVVHCYVHLFENCTQDWFAVASIVEHLLETIKVEQPNITEVYLRSDNGACYHNAPLMFTLPSIGTRSGVRIKRYDFSEPQAGKDICDRKIAPMKAHIRRYVNEKNNVITASDMKKALESHGGVRGCKAAVVAVDTNMYNERGKENKLKGISKLNNFEFKDEGIQVWRAYNIGHGQLISFDAIQPQRKTGLIIIEPFGATQPSSLISRPVPKPSLKAEVFFCNVAGCVLTFTCESDAEAHMDTGIHNLVPEKESLYDSVRRKWAQNVSEIVSTTKEVNVANVNEVNLNSSTADLECTEQGPSEGWALKCQKTGSKTSANVKVFLIGKFNEGLQRGQKASPANVSREMQRTKDSEGCFLFTPEEWKTERQIASFFSRLTALQRKEAHPITIHEEEHFDEEECKAIEENTASQNLRDAVYEAADIGHPLIFEGHNICELARNNKLTNFKVAELDRICSLYGLVVDGSRKRKLSYVNSIATFAKVCPCFR